MESEGLNSCCYAVGAPVVVLRLLSPFLMLHQSDFSNQTAVDMQQ